MLHYLKTDGKWLSIVACVLAIATLLSVCIGISVNRVHGLRTQESKVPTMQANQSYTKVKLEDLTNTLKKSSDKAKTKYLNQNVEITGKIKEWDTRGVSFTLDTGKKSKIVFNCRVLSDSQRALVRSCHKKQSVTVKGIITLVSSKAGYEINVKSLTLN